MLTGMKGMKGMAKAFKTIKALDADERRQVQTRNKVVMVLRP
jgi:hypothetical protein